MSRGIGSSVLQLAVFLAILLIVLPVSADNVTINATTVATSQITIATTNTTIVTSQTTVATTNTTVATSQTTIATSQTTPTPMETTVTITPSTTITPAVNPTISVEETKTTGSMMIYSSPAGATILIDGVYSGITPKTVEGISAGNHILRLELSRYYNYEGSVYVVPGQMAQGYGTLQPMSQVTSVSGVVVPVIVPVATATPLPTQDPGLLGNSSVVIAIIGAITVMIAAGTSIFIHLRPPKKE